MSAQPFDRRDRRLSGRPLFVAWLIMLVIVWGPILALLWYALT